MYIRLQVPTNNFTSSRIFTRERRARARARAERMGFCPPAACLAARPALRIAKLIAYTPPVEEALESAVEAAVDAASKVVASPSGAGFWQLTFAFVCGGLFFATVTATAGAVYAFGIDNVKRGLRLFGLLWRRVTDRHSNLAPAVRPAIPCSPRAVRCGRSSQRH